MEILVGLILILILTGVLLSNGKHDPEYNAKEWKDEL